MAEIQTRMIGTPEALDALLLYLERSGLIVHRRSRRKDGKVNQMRQYLLIEVEPGQTNTNLEPTEFED